MSIAIQNFTDAGRTMLGRANNGELLTFDTIVIGAGAAAAPADIYPLTALIDHRFDVAITAQVDQGNGILMLDGVINSVDIPAGQGFNLCELGLMAHIAAEAPALYSAANVFATTPDYIPDAVENPTAVHAFKIKVVIDRAPNVTVVLGTSIDILAENIGPAMDPNSIAWPGVFHEKLANTLRFKRLTPGPGIEITEEPVDPFNITIGQKTLLVDLDLYVPLTHPGGTPATRFATIQEAHDYLLEYTIPANVTARINVDAGLLVLTSPVVFNHPNLSQVQLLGATPITKTVVAGAGGGFAGTAPNYSLGVYLDDVTGLAGGDLVNLYEVGPIEANGCWEVTGVDVANSYVTLAVTCYQAGLTGTVGIGRFVTKYPTQLSSPAGPAIRINGNNGMQLIQDIAIIGDPASSGIELNGSGKVSLRKVDISGCIFGVFSLGSFLFYSDRLALCSNQNDGFNLTGGQISFDGNCAFCGNGVSGLVAIFSLFTSLIGINLYANGNGGAGVNISSNSSLIFTESYVWFYRNNIGAICNQKSSIRLYLGTIGFNTGPVFTAGDDGLINALGCTVYSIPPNGNPSIPPLGPASADGSYIIYTASIFQEKETP